MTKKLIFLPLIALLLTACGEQYNYQTTYQPILNPETAHVTLNDIKPLLEQRLSKVDFEASRVSIENNKLVVDIKAEVFDIAKAGGLGAQYNLTLEEPRTALTPTEIEAVNTHNQKQRDLMQQAYTAAQTSTNIDQVVLDYSEQVNQIARGVRGPSTQAQVREELYWKELVKTEVGQLTIIVEKPDTLWFAKVLEKNTTDPNNQKIKYQQVTRTLERPEPYLGYMPVINLGQYITKAEVITKDPSITSNKNYAVKVVLNEAGRSALEETTKKHIGKTLRFSLDKFPYAPIKITAPITDGTLIIDDSYNQGESTQIASKLSTGYLPVSLSIVSFDKR